VEWITFVVEQVRFLIVMVAVLFVPGWVLLSLIDRRKLTSPLEVVMLSMALSLGVAIITTIGLDVVNVPIDARSLSMLYGLYLGVFVFVIRSTLSIERHTSIPTKRTVSVSAIVIFAIIIAIKSVFFAGNAVPISTDLGHHTYWMEKIVRDGQLPTYEEREIIMAESSQETHRISDPQSISDVIVGEHSVFAILSILSGTSLISMYPMATLFVIHLTTIAAVYALARRLFAKSRWRESITVLTLLLSGVLFGLDSPQMKYVVGGVVGNTLGNMLILSGILALVIGALKRSSAFLSIFVIITFVLAYTHHLSTLLFALSLVSMAIVLTMVDFRKIQEDIIPAVFSVPVLATFVLGFVAFFFVWTPSYISNSAVETVVGQSQKEEHLGISIGEFLSTMGETRTAVGLLGIAVLVWLVWRAPDFLGGKRQSRLAFSVVVGWVFPLLLLVFFPFVVGIDLPTVRTANYTIFPLVITASVLFVWVLSGIIRLPYRRNWLGVLVIGVVMTMLIFDGFADNARLLGNSISTASARELHRVAEYLGKQYGDSERVVLYDHISLNGGSWMKLYFLRDYNYPFYRAHLFRYDRVDDRQEKCTLWAFSSPDSPEAEKCFDNLSIGALALDDTEAGKPFREHPEFERVYDGREISVYGRVRDE
jgi:hypothetical protein